MARHAVVEKMDEETTTAAAKFYDFAMGIYNGTAVNTTPSPAMVCVCVEFLDGFVYENKSNTIATHPKNTLGTVLQPVPCCKRLL